MSFSDYIVRDVGWTEKEKQRKREREQVYNIITSFLRKKQQEKHKLMDNHHSKDSEHRKPHTSTLQII